MDRNLILTTIIENIIAVNKNVAHKNIDEADDISKYCSNDPVEKAEIISRVMKQLKIRIPRFELIKIKSIKQLIDIFEKYYAQSESST